VRLLIVDDDPGSLAVVQEVLTAAGMEVIAARTAEEGEAALASKGVSLVLLGLALPDADGRTVATKLAQSSATAGIPVLMLSRTKHEVPRTESRRLGVAGWLDKPLDRDALVTMVQGALQGAPVPGGDPDRDPRTGAASRAALVRAYTDATNEGRLASALALVDVDALAAVNAAHGPGSGDSVLRHVGGRLAEALRPADTVAAWRDDEFVVLLPATDVPTAKRLLARAQAVLTTSPPTGPDGVDITVTLSAGITSVRPGVSFEAAIGAADRALALAKTAGPSTVMADEEEHPAGAVAVLIAEDDRVTATLVRHRMERAGYQVTHCASGTDALAAATASRFGLFILDIRMPGMDGMELLKRLRAMPEYARTPIIMLTTLGREEDIVRAFDQGASDYVTKPFSPVELLARVQRLVRESTARPAS
jgi:diguanylate cyclase (GGDEF)-like protein